MDKEELKKEFEELYKANSEADNFIGEETIRDMFWNFIQKALSQQAKEIIKDMLVEQKDLPYNIKVFTEPEKHIKEIEAFAKDEGHNTCCAIQKQKADKIIEKYAI